MDRLTYILEWLLSYRKVVLVILTLGISFCFVVLGFMFGTGYMCNGQLDGFLDSDLQCHLNYTEPVPTIINYSDKYSKDFNFTIVNQNE